MSQTPIVERVMKFIVNPVSGDGRAKKILPHLIDTAKKIGVNFDLQMTQAPEHATELANDPTGQFDVMVAVGGDGTVNEVATGAIKSQKIMGVIPAGTGNDFVRAVGRLRNLHEYIHRVINGNVRSIDVGTVHMESRELLFVNGVGVGFDAEVAKEISNVRRLKGISKYLYAVIKTLSKYNSCIMKIELDDRVIEQKTFLVAIGNGVSAGGGFLFTPHALLDDGLLDGCIASELSIPKVLRLLPSVLSGTHEKHPEVIMAKSKHIKIQSETPVSIHRDGEVSPAKVNDIDVHIVPHSLKIMA